MPDIRFTTLSGSTYEISGDRVRRVNPGYEKRADGDWVQLINIPTVTVGAAAVLVLDSLGPYGPDDHGSIGPAEATTRVTSIVQTVEVL